MSTKMDPIHPGEVLLEDFIKPYGLTAHKLSLELHVPANRISDIIRGHRGITAATALRLAKFFDTSPEFWTNLQSHYDLQVAEDDVGQQIEREVARVTAAS